MLPIIRMLSLAATLAVSACSRPYTVSAGGGGIDVGTPEDVVAHLRMDGYFLPESYEEADLPVQFCVNSLGLSSSEPSRAPIEIPIQRSIGFGYAGTDLFSGVVREGLYSRIDLDVARHCNPLELSPYSVLVHGPSRTFTDTGSYQIQFLPSPGDAGIQISGGEGASLVQIGLNFRRQIESLLGIRSSAEIPRLMRQSGTAHAGFKSGCYGGNTGSSAHEPLGGDGGSASLPSTWGENCRTSLMVVD
ncbi:MAG: hypothetical protein AB7P04_05625 [Bacteriovoracia bacterium]